MNKRHVLPSIVSAETAGIVQCSKQEKMQLDGHRGGKRLYPYFESKVPLLPAEVEEPGADLPAFYSSVYQEYIATGDAVHTVCLPASSSLKKGYKWSHGGIPGPSPG